MNRFRIKKDDSMSHIEFKANTTQEIYNYIEKQDPLNLESYMIDCTVDDIEVDCQEFRVAFREGECPADLSFF